MKAHARGEPSAHLPPTAFVNFLQNHDQIGNRALGERLAQLVTDEAPLLAATAIVLLAPAPPMLFMGEEWAAPEPFLYFCDFEPELAEKVREGRRREFARFAKFQAPRRGELDSGSRRRAETFEACRLDWATARASRATRRWLEHYRRLLAIRQRDIVPRIPDIRARSCAKLQDNGAFSVDWLLEDRSTAASDRQSFRRQPAPAVRQPAGRVLFATHPNIRDAVTRNELAPWSVTWLFERAARAARGRSHAASRHDPGSARHLSPPAQREIHLPRRHRAGAVSRARSASATSTARRTSRRGRAACTATTSSITTASTPRSAPPRISSASSRRCARTRWATSSTSCPTMSASARTTPGGWTCSRTARPRAMRASSTSTGRSRGKLLIPVLGETYGAVLERGELQLRHDARAATRSRCSITSIAFRSGARTTIARGRCWPTAEQPSAGRAARSARRPGLSARLLASRGRRDQLPALLRRQRPCGAAHGERRGLRSDASAAAGADPRGQDRRPAHRSSGRAVRPGALLREAAGARRTDLSAGREDPRELRAAAADAGRSAAPRGTTSPMSSTACSSMARPGAAWIAPIAHSSANRRTGADAAYEAKQLVLETSLAAELNVLTHALTRIARADPHTRDFTPTACARRWPRPSPAFRSTAPTCRTLLRTKTCASSTGRSRSPSAAARASIRCCSISCARRCSWTCPRRTRTCAGACTRSRCASSRSPRQSPRKESKTRRSTASIACASLNEVGGDPDIFGVSVRGFPRGRAQSRAPLAATRCSQPRRTTRSARRTCARASTCSRKCPRPGASGWRAGAG